MKNQDMQNWTTPILKEIATARQEVEAHTVSAKMYAAAASKVSIVNDYAKYTELIDKSNDCGHKAFLASYRLKSLQHDLDYDLGKYERDEYLQPEESDNESEYEEESE